MLIYQIKRRTQDLNKAIRMAWYSLALVCLVSQTAIHFFNPLTQPAPTTVIVQPKIVMMSPETQPFKAETIGEFKITYYSASVPECGSTHGITKSGAKVWDGVTVAVDPNVIPLGTYLYIEGVGLRVAQDTGGAVKGNVIDVYVPTSSEAFGLGTKQCTVYKVMEGANQ